MHSSFFIRHISQNDIIKHTQTGHFINFYASQDGVLREGCPEGPGLYLFATRRHCTVRLNPILASIQ